MRKGAVNERTLVFLAGVLMIVAGSFFLLGGSGNPEDSTSLQNESSDFVNDTGPESYAKPNESVASETSSEEADLQVDINSEGIAPARPKLSVGDVVEWTNNRESAVTISIDRTEKEISLEPGQSESLSFSGKTYYQVYEDGDLVARASLNVE